MIPQQIVVLLGVVILLIMLRGLYVMETSPEVEEEARDNLNDAKQNARETLNRVKPGDR